MSYTPSAAAQATATLAGSNEASLASPLTALQTSITGGNLAPAAFMDAILSSLGFQLESNNALSSHNNGGSTSFADIPGTSITWTPPLTKPYTVHCNFAGFCSIGVLGFVRLVVNGSNGPSIILSAPNSTPYEALHLMHNASFSAGSNTIKMQWASNSGTTLTIDANCYANYIVTG